MEEQSAAKSHYPNSLWGDVNNCGRTVWIMRDQKDSRHYKRPTSPLLLFYSLAKSGDTYLSGGGVTNGPVSQYFPAILNVEVNGGGGGAGCELCIKCDYVNYY